MYDVYIKYNWQLLFGLLLFVDKSFKIIVMTYSKLPQKLFLTLFLIYSIIE